MEILEEKRPDISSQISFGVLCGLFQISINHNSYYYFSLYNFRSSHDFMFLRVPTFLRLVEELIKTWSSAPFLLFSAFFTVLPLAVLNLVVLLFSCTAFF